MRINLVKLVLCLLSDESNSSVCITILLDSACNKNISMNTIISVGFINICNHDTNASFLITNNFVPLN